MDEADFKWHKKTCELEKYCAENPKIVLIGGPHVDMFHLNKLILPIIDEAIKVMPNDDKFIFMFADKDNLGPKVVIKNKFKRCN